ncbi:MAG: aminotransferase class I/II-fold pyridoxal phosphate-dependent enzyme [Candidatus Heimdallarchaeaceae archaeon]
MKIELFELERRQSLWENIVEYNLTESGFHPFSLREILNENQIEDLLKLKIGYGQTNGSIDLRNAISSLYKGASKENITVTNGSAESNFLIVWSLLEPKDELIVMLPNYMQIWGIARSFGAKVKPFHLKEELRWQPDLDELRNLITDQTKMIAVCNPNNPTGSILTRNSMEEIIDIANEADAWILSDEVYRGAEINGVETTSFYGLYDKVLAVGGLSKAYSLPGLRMGWVVAPEKIANQIWSYKDYTTIAPSALSQEIATLVLSTPIREAILHRNRQLLRDNVQLFDNWMNKHRDILTYIPPQAAAIAFVRYSLNINSTELTTKLREEKSLLVVAGDCFGMDNYLRIGIGSEKEFLSKGLNLLSDMFEEVSNSDI